MLCCDEVEVRASLCTVACCVASRPVDSVIHVRYQCRDFVLTDAQINRKLLIRSKETCRGEWDRSANRIRSEE